MKLLNTSYLINLKNNSNDDRCNCCPCGYHIDLGFVKFAEDVSSGKQQVLI